MTDRERLEEMHRMAHWKHNQLKQIFDHRNSWTPGDMAMQAWNGMEMPIPELPQEVAK